MSEPWNLPEREVTPELAVLSRRKLLTGLGIAGGLAVAGGAGLWWWSRGTDQEVLTSGKTEEVDLWAMYYPAKPNPKFPEIDTPVTREPDAARYCNYYEFSPNKDVWKFVEPFQPHPWTLEVQGLVAKPKKFAFEDLLKTFPIEQRIYRLRCVERWAMVVPWSGFSLAALLKKVEPLPSAKYVRFTTMARADEAGQIKQRPNFPWPYTEGLTMAEATNELTFLATGMYGHSLLKQHGAPIRLVVPWKYGFKSAKSLVRIELTAEQPATFWNTMAPVEYGFGANVDPGKPHPRWSQATEQMLDTRAFRKTEIYNGYGAWVGGLYKS